MPFVILLANQDKVAASDAQIRVRNELERHQVEVRIASTEMPISTDGALMLVVFGGDGTLLAAARMYAYTGVPILPIHVGRFGFITESDSTQVWSHVKSALEGALEVHTRAMLYASVECEGEVISASPAVNDVVVACSSRRLVDLDVHVDDDLVAGYAADGVVVASPTGSTGYALSAGGPLMHPDVQAMLITPIAAHTLSARSLVIPMEGVVRISVPNGGRGVVDATIDGQVTLAVPPNGRVYIRKNRHGLVLVKGTGMTFYEKVRHRWRLGERRTATPDNNNTH
jgi:NAD+ kinase